MKLLIKFTGYSGETSSTRVRTIFTDVSAEQLAMTGDGAYWFAIHLAIDQWCADNKGERRGWWLTVEEID